MTVIMRRMIGLICAVFITGTAASAQTSVNLSMQEARAVAMQALLAGESALALDLAHAILSQLPDDRSALIIIAAAAAQQGDPAAGRRAGARAFALSGTDLERYEAARLTALAAFTEGRFNLATFWLRRALIVAPDDAERAQVLADGRLVRRRNPWSFDLAASLAPSSNVNGGASGNLAAAPGTPTGTLSDDAQALAGWRGALALGATYRLWQSPVSRTLIGARYQGVRLRITDAVAVPDAALATDEVTLHLRHDRALDSGRIGAQLSYMLVDYRDLDNVTLQTDRQRYSEWQIEIDRRVPIGADMEIGLTVGRSWTVYELAAISDVLRSSFAVSYGYALPRGDQFAASIRYGDASSSNPNYRSTDWTAQISYDWAEPIGPVTLGFSGGIAKRAYPDYAIGPFVVAGGRRDNTLFYSANIGFPDISYAGFTPVMTITGSKTDSNVTRFTSESLSTGLMITSAF
jgi:hypothetical protein